MAGAAFGRVPVAALLLERGAAVEHRCDQGRTALM